MSTSEYGVYVHIPFCRHRCDYCAFATWTDRDHLMSAYADAVVEDINRTVRNGLPVADTVFFGGGTPTRIDPRDIARIVSAIPVSSNPEITVECNPDDVTDEMMQVFAGAGVNRVSIGVQAMVDDRQQIAHAGEVVAVSIAVADGDADIAYTRVDQTPCQEELAD